MEEFTLTAEKVSVEFPGVKALDAVDFEIKGGEICAVAGANGAGKSTLMKVLSGSAPFYKGEICCNGQRVLLRNPADAAKLGIHIVYQEIEEAILPDFTVAENLMMTDFALGKKKRYHRKRIVEDAGKILSELQLDFAPQCLANELTLSEKQLLLIAKAVHQECRLLILDEPTAALSKGETERLFQMIRFMAKEKGSAVVFISHRIQEIMEICEKCMVMRNGHMVAEVKITPETKQSEITSAMFGISSVLSTKKGIKQNVSGKLRRTGDSCPYFEVKNLCDYQKKFQNVSFCVEKGEIVGLAGLTGAGKTEICKALFGAGKTESGEIRIDGKPVTLNNPGKAVRKGIALVPERRRSEGIFPTMETSFNLGVVSLQDFCRLGFWKKRKMEKCMDGYLKKIGIICSSGKQEIQFLSGGNQQKTVIGKWMAAKSSIYILDEPMQGVDVGAKQEIFALIRALAEEGKSVIYASSDASELLGVTDRIYVLGHGMVTEEFYTEDLNEQELMGWMLGGVHHG